MKTGAKILIGAVSASIVVGLTIAIAVNVVRAIKDPHIIAAAEPSAAPATADRAAIGRAIGAMLADAAKH
jgi:hypothetical protein